MTEARSPHKLTNWIWVVFVWKRLKLQVVLFQNKSLGYINRLNIKLKPPSLQTKSWLNFEILTLFFAPPIRNQSDSEICYLVYYNYSFLCLSALLVIVTLFSTRRRNTIRQFGNWKKTNIFVRLQRYWKHQIQENDSLYVFNIWRYFDKSATFSKSKRWIHRPLKCQNQTGSNSFTRAEFCNGDGVWTYSEKGQQLLLNQGLMTIFHLQIKRFVWRINSYFNECDVIITNQIEGHSFQNKT